VQLAIHGSSYGQSPTPFTLACGLLMKLGGLSKSTIDFLSKMRFTPSDATVLECMRIGCNNVLGTVKKHSQNFSFVLKCKLLVVIGDNWNKKICQHRQREGHNFFWTVPTTQVIYRLFDLPRDLWRESMPFPIDMNPDNIDVVIPAVAPTINEASIENLRPFLNSGIFPSGLADDVKDEAESRLSFWSIFPYLPLQSSVFIANVIILFCALLLSWGKMENFVTVLIVDQEGITSLQNDPVVAKLKIFDNTAVLVANDVDSVFQRGIAQANGNLTEYFAPFKPVPPGSDLEKVGEK
jgi:hypothetical protein